MILKDTRKSYFFAILTVLLWSTVATAFKIGLNHFQPYLLLFYSSLTSLLFFLIVLKFSKRKKINLTTKSLINSAILGFINPFLYYLVLFEAYKLLPAQIAQPLNYTWVIVVSVLLSVFIVKGFKISNFIGLIISFVGVVILSSQGEIRGTGEINILGVILALSSSLLWGAYWLLSIKDKRVDFEKLAFNFLFGTIFIFIYILFAGEFEFNIEGILSSIYIGMFEMGLTFYIWIKALKYSTNPAKTGNIIYLTPFISLFFISFILKEAISVYSIIGLVFIVAGILYTSLKK